MILESAVQTSQRPCSSASVLISACFEARTQAHVFHLQTTNYATHVALQAFYDGIVGLVDAYAESYQGVYGIISEYPTISFGCKEPIGCISELRDIIDNIRTECGTRSELQNDIDSIVALCNCTLYKLTNLK